MKENSAEKYKCDYCDSDISLLTKKLQQHPTSHLWIRHGQCCAACKSVGEINGINNIRSIAVQDFDKSPNDNGMQSGDYNGNKTHSLAREAEIEDEVRLNIRKQARRTIRAGNIIASVSLVAAFLFFYYEYFHLAIAALIMAIAGVVLCRLGVWKKCRIE